MPDRRRTVLEAAVRVLAEGGSRALTHRAVDAEAGVPEGTCSNHFRTRALLVRGVADELERRDRDFLGSFDPEGIPAETLPDLAAAFIMSQLAEPTGQRARLALALDRDADLSPHHDRLCALLRELCARVDIAEPAAKARAVTDYLDGVLVNGLTVNSRTVDGVEVADAVRRLLA